MIIIKAGVTSFPALTLNIQGKRNHNLTRKLSEHVVESKTKQTMDIQYEIVDTECIMKMKVQRCSQLTTYDQFNQ